MKYEIVLKRAVEIFEIPEITITTVAIIKGNKWPKTKIVSVKIISKNAGKRN